MNAAKTGVLPMQDIKQMFQLGIINAKNPITYNQIQPASMDLRLGSTAYRIRASFLTGRDNKVNDRIESFCMHSMDLTSGAVLEKGCVYLVELQESLNLTADIYAAANAKSSTGRLDILTRLIADGGIEFDRIGRGYNGPLYAEICPRSFSVKVRTGSKLNQLRFRQGNSILDDAQITRLHHTKKIVTEPVLVDDGLGFSVDLRRPNQPVGYRAKSHTGIIDIDKVQSFKVADFWEPVFAVNEQLILDPESFYILVSKECVRIPPLYAAEMMPYIAMIGEFRVHYAGFFDPGFGWDQSGNLNSRAVLEVRCHEVPFTLEHGQQVGRLCFEQMLSAPKQLYGADAKSNYQGQGLRLSKHFCE